MDKDGDKEREGEWGGREMDREGDGRVGGKGAVGNVAVCFVGFSQLAFFFI